MFVGWGGASGRALFYNAVLEALSIFCKHLPEEELAGCNMFKPVWRLPCLGYVSSQGNKQIKLTLCDETKKMGSSSQLGKLKKTSS